MRLRTLPMGVTALWLGMNLGWLGSHAHAQQSPRLTCPEEMETLVSYLLADLPAYANRVGDRLRPASVDLWSYIITAGRPEFEPLPLKPPQIASADPIPDSPQQVFITTLERQYLGDRVSQIQEFHWIFLTRSTEGWRLAFMYTRTGGYPGTQPPSPPRESSDGVIGRAIELWLRDCRAGILRVKPEQRSPINLPKPEEKFPGSPPTN